MLKLEDVKAGIRIKGVFPSEEVTVVCAEPIGNSDTLSIAYRRSSGEINQMLLDSSYEEELSIAEEGRRISFNADSKTFKRVLEALRIDWASLFDPMMAIHSSRIDPLPHQISAVYDEMLPRNPLRFILADDPGAGKTLWRGCLSKSFSAAPMPSGF